MIILDIRVKGLELGQLVDKATRERLEKVEGHSGLGELKKYDHASRILDVYIEEQVERAGFLSADLVRLAKRHLYERELFQRLIYKLDRYAERKAPEGSKEARFLSNKLDKDIAHHNSLLRLNNAGINMIERRL